MANRYTVPGTQPLVQPTQRYPREFVSLMVNRLLPDLLASATRGFPGSKNFAYNIGFYVNLTKVPFEIMPFKIENMMKSSTATQTERQMQVISTYHFRDHGRWRDASSPYQIVLVVMKYLEHEKDYIATIPVLKKDIVAGPGNRMKAAVGSTLEPCFKISGTTETLSMYDNDTRGFGNVISGIFVSASSTTAAGRGRHIWDKNRIDKLISELKPP